MLNAIREHHVKNLPVPAFLRESIADQPPEAIDLTGDEGDEQAYIDLDTFVYETVLVDPTPKNEHEA